MFKFNDDLINFLIVNNLTISSAESFTGGMFASSMICKSGASKYFVGSAVTYSKQSKIDILDIPEEVIDKNGTISREVSFLMAQGAKYKFKSDISISFTGNAGPNPIEGKEVGLFYITIFIQDVFLTKEYLLDSKLTRDEIRDQALKISNDLLNNLLLKS